MLVKTYNQKGEEIGQTRLPKEIFEVPINSDLVHQVVLVQQANRRQKIAKTKDRAEVRGGGRKPWRQKGTGRARHGSIRSPLWKGGGVTFGPTRERNFKKRITRAMRKTALLSVLGEKARRNLLFFIALPSLQTPKTKALKEIFEKLPCGKAKTLLILPGRNEKLLLSARNLPYLNVIQAKDLNALDLLNAKYIVLPKESLKVLEETFAK